MAMFAAFGWFSLQHHTCGEGIAARYNRLGVPVGDEKHKPVRSLRATGILAGFTLVVGLSATKIAVTVHFLGFFLRNFKRPSDL